MTIEQIQDKIEDIEYDIRNVQMLNDVLKLKWVSKITAEEYLQNKLQTYQAVRDNLHNKK